MVMNTLRFTIPGPPVPKARARRGKGKHWYTPAPTRKYEAHCRSMATLAEAEWRRVSGWTRTWDRAAWFGVETTIYFPDARRRDADNVFKSIGDACNGVLWDDDSQIAEHVARKRIDRDNPRVEVEVRSMPAYPSSEARRKS